ncbi:hypothetical protein BVX98_00035 [bacterium F11]|nr:hypothetical protein BVX98_00035 [bacterium F11]
MILDLKLPGLNGLRICRLIKRDWNMKATKVLALTAYQPEKARKLFINAGADGFDSKPFDNQ